MKLKFNGTVRKKKEIKSKDGSEEKISYVVKMKQVKPFFRLQMAGLNQPIMGGKKFNGKLTIRLDDLDSTTMAVQNVLWCVSFIAHVIVDYDSQEEEGKKFCREIIENTTKLINKEVQTQ